ncbi:MAG: L-ribulose-5-phosphate 3-epimerase [Phycisphaerales bacterium]|jgi:L-ribulose-5-phosphate 3-epimerase
MNPDPINRRQAVSRLVAISAAVAAAPSALGKAGSETMRDRGQEPAFKVSLAQWSLHPLLFEDEMTNLDFAAEARALGFGAIEYVNAFFKDKARDKGYLNDLNTRAKGEGVEQLLIMIDGEGRLGAPDANERGESIDNHVRWLEAAATLGCHSIRVNAASEGTYEEQQRLAADGLRRLTELGDAFRLNVIVENHGGLSSNGQWLAGVMELVDHPRCGTLPDFGNFCFDWEKADDPEQWYDRYQGVGEMMPFAKAVSAKSHEFDAEGNETQTDFRRMLGIVVAAGYHGHVGVEYEGKRRPPREGTVLTRELLERVRAEMAEG